MHFSRTATVAVAAIAVSACAALPRDQGYAQTTELIRARIEAPPAPERHVAAFAVPEIPSEALTVDHALRLAMANNPRVREAYARLGIGRAELEDARRIANPSFEFERLKPDSGDGAQITRGFSLGISDLLLLPARKRFAIGELDRVQKEVAAELIELASEVESAWFESVSAQQVATMRDLVATATQHSATLAQRFFDAGNIHRLQLEQERAAAAQARIEAVRASAGAMRARSELAALIGLPSSAAWSTIKLLPAPPSPVPVVDELLALAQSQRLDLAAGRKEVELRQDMLDLARRWRWIGAIEVGGVRESEIDGGVLRGPSASIELPIFNQAQGPIERARAERDAAQARLDQLEFKVRNEVQLGVDQLSVAADIAERYRTLLLPPREAIVARTQERVNFMLIGVFELLQAKTQAYDAYQEYLESVRDYWVARTHLRHLVGGRLPEPQEQFEPTIGVDAVLPAEEAAPMDHSGHQHMHHSMDHAMPSPAAPANTPQEHAEHAEHASGHRASKNLPASKSKDERPQEKRDHDDHDHEHHDHGDSR